MEPQTRTRDSIRIELIVQAVQGYENDVYMDGDLQVFINQRKPYDESSDIVEEETLLDSMEEDGEYFIFSCCCGVPACSGWERGISVQHDADTIRWTDENKQQSWVFEKSSIEKQMKKVREEAVFFKQFFAKQGIRYVGVGYSW